MALSSLSSGGTDFALDVDIVESLSADINATLEELAEVAMSAADAVEAWGKGELRADTRSALGNKVANTWRSEVWPNRGGQASISPSIGWWSNAPHIIRAFSDGLTIRAGEGKYLLIPTENAPQFGYGFGQSGRMRKARAYALTMAERRFGRLRYVKAKGRDLILVLADKVQRNKRGYGRASASTLRRKKHENGVVMFIMVPAATMPKTIDPDAIADAIGREGLERFARAFRDVATRHYGTE